jgi:hypothetical protein
MSEKKYMVTETTNNVPLTDDRKELIKLRNFMGENFKETASNCDEAISDWVIRVLKSKPEAKTLDRVLVHEKIWELLGIVNYQDVFISQDQDTGEYIDNENTILLDDCVTAICKLAIPENMGKMKIYKNGELISEKSFVVKEDAIKINKDRVIEGEPRELKFDQRW